MTGAGRRRGRAGATPAARRAAAAGRGAGVGRRWTATARGGGRARRTCRRRSCPTRTARTNLARTATVGTATGRTAAAVGPTGRAVEAAAGVQGEATTSRRSRSGGPRPGEAPGRTTRSCLRRAGAAVEVAPGKTAWTPTPTTTSCTDRTVARRAGGASGGGGTGATATRRHSTGGAGGIGGLHQGCRSKGPMACSDLQLVSTADGVPVLHGRPALRGGRDGGDHLGIHLPAAAGSGG